MLLIPYICWLMVNTLNIHTRSFEFSDFELKSTTALPAITQHSVININFNMQQGMQIFLTECTIIEWEY
jgi:hypothetical protein